MDLFADVPIVPVSTTFAISKHCSLYITNVVTSHQTALATKQLHRNMEFNRIPQRSFKSIDCSFYPTEQIPLNKLGQLVVS